MIQDADQAVDTPLGRDRDQPPPWHAGRPQAQVNGSPVDRDHRAGAEPLEDVQCAVGIDVDAAVEGTPAQPVVPDRQHAADRQQGRVEAKAAAELVEDSVVGEVDVAGVMHGHAGSRHHVAVGHRRLGLAPATAVVACRDGDEIDTAEVEVITRCHFGDAREAEIGHNGASAARHHQVGAAIDRLEGPAVEMVDVGVGHQDRIDGAGAEGAPPPQRIQEQPAAADLHEGAGVSEPGHCGGRLGATWRGRMGHDAAIARGLAC